MSIRVVCQCGQAFKAPEDLAGKRVKCPECGGPLTIPQPEPEKPPRVEPAPGDAVPFAGEKEKTQQEAAAEGSCPACGAGMTPGAVLCLQCGFNVKLGQRMRTEAEEPPAAPAVPAAAGPPAARPAAGKSPPRSDRRGWIIVGTGLTISLASLMIGATAFAILAVAILIAVNNPMAILSSLAGAGGGRIFGILLSWCLVALVGSGFSLLTGWLVCCAVPESSEARRLIQATVGCAAATFALLLLMQLVATALTPALPSFSGFDPAASPAEMQQAQAEMQQAMQKRAQSAKTVMTVSKVFVWLAVLAAFGSQVAFALFLGAVGGYFDQQGLRRLALYFAGFQGACAAWFTLLMFVIDIDSAAKGKFLLIVSLTLGLATYGWLIYLNHQTRKSVPAGS